MSFVICCFPILHSPFSILHSPFSILHSPFSILHSPFSILHSPFSIPHSPFPIPMALNFSWLNDPTYQTWLKTGMLNTISLSVVCIILSLIIGLVGVWLQGLPNRWVRNLLQGYIQVFRNTPPLVQLFFLFFVLANLLPKVYDPTTGGEKPLLGSFASAAIAL
ncbi:MAG: ABC transporter permease subunit, partial [Symploca sp. SIO3E6]|nr:ABC transporter permease subunit [Caldora sp. SIO3E6]